ncbi:50S ribosomal protein L25 [Haloimpatiens lingqiaonensis]|uniref:50S ribosomal protein L25 n=1 Tax=Haloimpatiens lingqiaonensis TaxID=1380675 RepID=UPI001484D2D5|nr:50S ribosomal protein L25 [Haloimpatiens lingqiaonensis]
MNSVTALKRNEKGIKSRKAGYIPGVLYGTEVKESCPVKFQKSEMMKILKNSGDSAKLIVKLEDEKKYGVIKNIQRNSMNVEEIYNVDVQLVTKDEEIKQAVPIIFEGRASIENRGLTIQTQLTEVDVIAKAVDIPESFIIDIKDKKNGDVITVKQIEENEKFKIVNDPDGVIGSVFYVTKE